MLAAGAGYLALLQWHIHDQDIGTFYPWSLSAVAFGIVLGTVFEPIRLAHGGSTEMYAERAATVGPGYVVYGNRAAPFLAVGALLGLVADILALGRQRPAATIAGLLTGGLAALAPSSILAWRGDTDVAYLFFGNAWNIAWAASVLGAVTGAATGFYAGAIREQQQKRHQQIPENETSLPEGGSADGIKEAK